ncbi:MAG: hypothetical protein ACN4GZ_10500 [Acidimicrobiales bacterium]
MGMVLKNGKLVSGFVIFIRRSEATDRELLQAVNAADHELIEPSSTDHPTFGRLPPAATQGRNTVTIGNTADWTLIADDGSYRIFHEERSSGIVSAFLATGDEAFTYTMGDSDESHGFSYWLKGQRVRSYDVAPHWKSPPPPVEQGAPLPVESDIDDHTYERGLKVGVAMGFDPCDAEGSFRTYRSEKRTVDIGP